MLNWKCHICLKNLHGLEHEEKRWRKANLKKIKKGQCKHLKKIDMPQLPIQEGGK